MKFTKTPLIFSFSLYLSPPTNDVVPADHYGAQNSSGAVPPPPVAPLTFPSPYMYVSDGGVVGPRGFGSSNLVVVQIFKPIYKFSYQKF